MAKACDNCKTTGGLFKNGAFINFNGKELCSDCANKLIEKVDKEIIITGTESIEGYKIIEYIDVVSTEVIFGVGIGIGDIAVQDMEYFQDKFSITEKSIKKVKDILKKRLKIIAYEKEGNAIIKFRLGYEGISESRLIMTASGTIVKISEK